MPCFSMSNMETLLEGQDVDLIRKALEELGFTVRAIGGGLEFSGISNVSGRYHQGIYAGGILTTDTEFKTNDLKRGYAAEVLRKEARASGFLFRKEGKYYVTYKAPNVKVFKHEILPNGIVKTTSEKIPMAIHSAAEGLLGKLKQALNKGKGANTRRGIRHTHADTGTHVHGESGVQH